MNPIKQPPPAHGVRLEWSSIPAHIREAVENGLNSPVVRAETQLSGFSPGAAARLLLADGRRAFVKAISSFPNAEAVMMHRQEKRVTSLLPPETPSPRLLWSYDDGEWVVMVFEDIDGKHPAQPWQIDELDRVVDALVMMSDALTPSPLGAETVVTIGGRISEIWRGWARLEENPPATLDSWSARNLAALAAIERTAPEASQGDTLMHCDIRADNMLLTEDRVWIVDWPHACLGAAWVDVIFFAPSVTMQGGPLPEAVAARHPAYRAADPDAVTAVIAAIAGLFTHRSLQPPPPGLPTLRAFQAAQGEVARAWLAERTGLR